MDHSYGSIVRRGKMKKKSEKINAEFRLGADPWFSQQRLGRLSGVAVEITRVTKKKRSVDRRIDRRSPWKT